MSVRRLKALFLAVVLAAGVAAPVGAQPAGEGADVAVEITLWHALTGAHARALDTVVAGFNADQDAITVTAAYRGTPAETLAAALDAFAAGAQPDMLMAPLTATATLAAADEAIYPVGALMEAQGRPLNADDLFAPLASAAAGPDEGLAALPVATAAPVVFTNTDAWRAAGRDAGAVPDTWEAVFDTARAVVDAGEAPCGLATTVPVWVHLENLAAWHGVAFATAQDDTDEADARFVFADDDLVARHWADLAGLHAAGAYTHHATASEAVEAFASGDCATLVGATSDRPAIAAATAIDVAAHPLPVYADVADPPRDMILDGSALWATRGRPETHYAGIAAFLTHLARPQVQADWHEATGFLPLTPAASAVSRGRGFYAQNPGDALAVGDLEDRDGSGAVRALRFAHYDAIRAVFARQFAAVLDATTEPQAAVEDAQRIGNALLERFAGEAP